jgi:hypothetical protein
LHGIDALCVSIDDLEPEVEKHGLTKDKLREDIESKLRLASIKVVSEKESLKIRGMPCISLAINSMYHEPNHYYKISFLIIQDAYLFLKPDFICSSITWHRGFFGRANKMLVEKQIRDNVKDLVDKFLNDYLAVNPIHPGTTQKKK